MLSKKRKISRIISSLLVLFLFNLINFVYAVTVQVPPKWSSTDYAVNGYSQIETWEQTILETIKLINKYLWFSIWAVLLWIIVYSWIAMIFSNWNEENMKKYAKIFWYSFIWLWIAMLSYIIVRIIINLF